MAPQLASQPFITLRVITQRLALTPSWQLPHIVPHLASTISSCEELFCRTEIQSHGKESSETSVLVHKFKTRISALLQEKSSHAKWAAVILIKATIEAGGWEILRASGGWIRGLLDILGRPEPESTKVLCIITLTRVFLLTQAHQSIVREITTPSLRSFIPSGLNILKTRQSIVEERKPSRHYLLLSTILEAFCVLLPQHPTLFRPFITQIRDLILPLIAPTPSGIDLEVPQGSQSRFHCVTTESVTDPARKLHVLLNICAPKNTSGEEWTKSLHALIDTFHRTADRVFRAVIEDWEPSSIRLGSAMNTMDKVSETVNDLEQDSSGLPGWKGISAGIERLDGILQTVKIFLTTATFSTVPVPVSIIVDAVSRVLLILLPSNETPDQGGRGMRIKAEIGRDEREELWAELPRLHVSALELLSILISRLGYGSIALCHGILEQALWLIDSELASPDVRKTIYDLVSKILLLVGVSLPKSVSPSLSKCVRRCCEDILPSTNDFSPATMSSKDSSKNHSTNGASIINADSYFQSPMVPSTSSDPFTKVRMSASTLLPLTLRSIPRDLLSSSLRAQVDRVAILTNNKQAMLASVLNPPMKQKNAPEISSIMPFLARQIPSSLEVEALIRPRMPILQVGRGSLEVNTFDEDYDRTEDHDEDETFKTRTEIGKNYLPKIADTNTKNATSESENLDSKYHVPVTQPTTSKKRERDTSSNDENPTDPLGTQLPHPSTLAYTNPTANKRTRLEEDPQSTSDVADHATAYKNSAPQSSTPANIAPLQTAPLLPLQDVVTGIVGEGIDSDDSDAFELPRIDVGLDTDEEEEEEAEEEGGEEEEKEDRSPEDG